MTESRKLPQNGFDVELSPLSKKFLKFIKMNDDRGKSTYIKDIKDYFDYKKHQIVSRELDNLENNQLIESHRKDGRRVVDITAKGLDFVYALGCSCLSTLEQMWITKLRREGKIKDSLGTVSLIISEFTQNAVPNQSALIKDVILREFGEEEVPESSLENICESICQIFLESSKDFIENYSDRNPLL